MKKYLYEIDCGGVHEQGIPFMPRVLAEKTARWLNKEQQREYGRIGGSRYTVSKTTIQTKDVTPRGWESWMHYYNR